MSENVMMALEMMGQGMLGIFVVLGVIALLVLLLQKLDSKKKK
ncbi:OadG-related small transporter subunit [Lawsonibacter sp. LCP25S3_G6]